MLLFLSPYPFMRKLLIGLVLFCLCITTNAQLHHSDTLQISLITVDPGSEVYECFGHTALRIVQPRTHEDIVFHYGVYDYTEPHFIWHFVEGVCSYRMAACYTYELTEDYKRRSINITEQVLAIDSIQAAQLIQALLINYLPENRNYRYNFFFDNCATRPYDMITKYTHVQYDTTWIQPVTLRDMIHEMTGVGHWLDFGIALSVAGRADLQTKFREQMFLPKYLHDAVAHASVDGHPMVKSERYIENPGKASTDTSSWMDRCLSPMAIAILMLLVSLTLLLMDFKGRNVSLAGKTFDTIWLLATGIAGCIIWFLNFFSLHPAVDHNLNCLWLLPTNLLFIALIWIKKAQKVRRIYFFIIFAAVIIYIVGMCVSVQYCHAAFIPMIAAIAIRCLSNLYKKQ